MYTVFVYPSIKDARYGFDRFLEKCGPTLVEAIRVDKRLLKINVGGMYTYHFISETEAWRFHGRRDCIIQYI